MKYLRLYLKGFKPLLYGGTSLLEITDMDQIIVLTGENGKGKSSVLREMTPFPAVRTDYQKNGCKIIEIEHLGSHYVLTSDFSKTTAHSFRKDDVELNEGGTTDVQEDLVVQYFGEFTRLIGKLVSGQYKFSAMSRNERKQVIMATYPSDLSFVLEKHKNLATKIRAANSQLKLLHERELKLQETIVPDDVFVGHRQTQVLMNEALNALDQDIYMFTQAIEPYRQDPLFSRTLPYDLDGLLVVIDQLKSEYQQIIAEGYPAGSAEQLDQLKGALTSELSQLQETVRDLETRGSSLLEEVEKYRDCLATDQDELLQTYEQQAAAKEEIIADYEDDGTPVCDPDTLERLQGWQDGIQRNLQWLRDLQVPLWTREQFQEQTTRRDTLTYQLSTINRQLDQLANSLQAIEVRLAKHSESTWPEECHLRCPLKTSLEQILTGIRQERSRVIDSQTQLTAQAADLQNQLNSLEKELGAHSPSLVLIDQFTQLFSNNTWGEYVLNHQSFVNAANADVVGIYNRLVKVIVQSEKYQLAHQAMEQLSVLKLRIDAIKAENLPSRQLVKEILDRKERELKKLEHEVTRKRNRLLDVNRLVIWSGRHRELIDRMRRVDENLQAYTRQTILRKTVEFVEREISRMTETKVAISERLRELDTLVREQENLHARLDDEIRPNITKLQDDIAQWTTVEKLLSPVSGLPKQLIVRYINALFQRANRFIAQVWNYEMELQPLEETVDCDYTFPVLINRDGVVKDIAICSKGQREIIDLAILLSICTYRGYATTYPIKLDEMTSGLSPEHNSRLFGFLGELFTRSEIGQAFIVSHDPIINGGFDSAGYVTLSGTDLVPGLCKVISKTE